MLSIIDAMRASAGFTRPIREGEEVLRGKLVVAIGKKGKERDVVHVQSLVLRTSGLASKDPAVVEIWIDVSKDYGERVVKDNEEEFRKTCDCPAGNSDKCKHVMAVMLGLASLEEEELEDLSCTDLEQQWGALKKTTLKEFEAKPLSELCHVKGQRDVYVGTMPLVTQEMEEKWRNKLMNCAALSEYSLFFSRLRQGQGLASCEEEAVSIVEESKQLCKKLLTLRTWSALATVRKLTAGKLSQLPPHLVSFYEKFVAISQDKSLELLCAPQYSPAWRAARKFRLFASKAREQFTYFVNKKADWDGRYNSLYHGSFVGNTHTERGLADEPICRDKYIETNSLHVFEAGVLVRPEVPWLASSSDGTVVDSNGNIIGSVEIKSFVEGTRLTTDELIEMCAIRTLDVNGNVKKNHNHYVQMQLGMLLSGLEYCDYCIWSGVSQDYVCRRVFFDPQHCVEVCDRLVHVYFDFFLPRMYAEYGTGNDNVSDQSDDEEQD